MKPLRMKDKNMNKKINKKPNNKTNKKFRYINTIALLKHKDCDFELHLNPKRPCFWNGGNIFPLNLFQQFIYWILRFEYIDGGDYIELMAKRIKNKDYRGCDDHNKGCE